jgi:hypothetical protein
MPNHIRKRLSLHQDWTNDIPLKNIWGINFSARTGSGAMVNVGDAIEYYLDMYRPQTFKVDKDLIDRVSDFESGFLLAQSVAFPSEEVSITQTDIPNSGGFQPIPIGGGISTSHQLDISFLETNRDVFSYFFQPWVVATAYAGLIEDPTEPDIKCNIDVIQYSRSAEKYADKVGESNKISGRSEAEYGIRKMHTFYNCVPTVVNADNISYGEQTETDIIRTVGLNYEHYQLNTPRGVLNGI